MMQGKIMSALKLDEVTLRNISKKFEDMLGDQVSLTFELNEDMIGGFVAIIDDQVYRVYDRSVSAQLKEMRKYLDQAVEGESRAETVVEMDLFNPEEQAAKFKDKAMKAISSFEGAKAEANVGQVVKVGDGVVNIKGLANCKNGELLQFENDAFGIALNLDKEMIGAVLLKHQNDVKEGSFVENTGEVVSIPVGDELLGRVIDPIGDPLDGKGGIHTEKRRPIESEAPMIIDRQGVSQPLETGILSIDSMIPIGKGQRELIIGDRQTGKTAIAVDTILNQKGKNVVCIYVAIGQKASTIADIIHTLTESGAMEYSIIVAATASDSAPLQYIAPYSGCAIGEEFMEQGRDVLIVYDDLSKHAVAYRAMSLLLRRPPGREAYPGDVFYLHSRLLERAAKLSEDKGGGSMTALPIIETLAGDISAYIPTNVISITDGQIFLETELFNAGMRPAINVGLSVSRVGGSAQTKAMRKVAGQMRLDLAQYRELAVFSQFASDLDKATQEQLNNGARLTDSLIQPQFHPMSTAEQVILLSMITRKKLLGVPIKKIAAFNKGFVEHVMTMEPEIAEEITSTGVLSDEHYQDLSRLADEYKTAFLAADQEPGKPSEMEGKPEQ